MSDAPDGTLTDPTDLPPEGTTDEGQLNDPDPSTGDGTSDAEARVRKANREAQSLRKRLREFEAADQARKEAELTESERAQIGRASCRERVSDYV